MVSLIRMESMVTRARLLYTHGYLMPGICSLIKPAAMEKLIPSPTKIHTVIMWLLINGTKPSLEPMLNNHQWISKLPIWYHNIICIEPTRQKSEPCKECYLKSVQLLPSVTAWFVTRFNLWLRHDLWRDNASICDPARFVTKSASICDQRYTMILESKLCRGKLVFVFTLIMYTKWYNTEPHLWVRI